MLSSDDHDRLQSYLAGDSTLADAVAFELRLKREPELADALLRLAREEAILADWARFADRTEQVESGCTNNTPHRPAMNVTHRWFALAAAVTIAIGAAWFAIGLSNDDNHLASVQEVAGQVWLITKRGRETLVAGQELVDGQGLELVGDHAVAVVVYPDRTRLEFDGDTVVTGFFGGDGAAKQVHLSAGNVRAEVAKQPQNLPMTLKTANAEVVVLGTKFDLSGSALATYVETSEGAVRLTRAGDGQSIEVPAGFEGLADNGPDMNAQASPPRYRQPRLTTSGCDRTTLLSPDGLTLVTSRFGDGNVTLWDAAAARKRMSFTAHAGQIDALAFSPDGNQLATGGVDRKIHLWDPATARQLQSFDAPDHLQSLCFSARGTMLFGVARPVQSEVALYSWNLTTGKLFGPPHRFVGEVCAFSPLGQTLAVASVKNDSVTLWDLTSSRERTAIPKMPGRVHALGISRDDSMVAVSDKTGRVAVYEIDSGKERQAFFPPGGSAQGLAFSPSGSQLAMGMRYATVRVWDLATGKQQYILEGAKRPGATASVRPMYFSPDARTLVSTESLGDSLVRVWDLPAK